MPDPPGTMPADLTRSHPRRPPAHKSVSLRHSPLRSDSSLAAHQLRSQPTVLSSPNPASDKANPPSVSPKLFSNKHSSGESSDAGRWFDTTNNNAHQRRASFTDNEPPFFLRNSSSSETPPEGYIGPHAHAHPTMAYRPGLAHIGTDGSSTEDFRSVIDDLTIANKKLKQKLKKYERMHDSHHQADKLFEVKFHGLPDHKKKELEATLRKFAAELDDGATANVPQISSYTPALDQQNTVSSTSRFGESGYVSMSASGKNSSVPSNQASNQADDRRKMSRSAYNRQQQSIQSYLHDIPMGLQPTSNAPMTDKSKKKLVVRRLEQIFAGKRSAPGGHPQPLQQEEVAQSAATADREEREATGHHFRPEGQRVARIMPERHNQDENGSIEALQRLRPDLNVGEQDLAGSGSPDQRPTRPLDLDPHRAQVPRENMSYIRHLGFTPPDMDSGDIPEDGHGWLYLNLLINMAQLHTLSVTPDFVKDALTDYSSQLELSHDGRKIRWKGGLEVTRNSSDSASEQWSSNSPYDQGSPSKRLKTEESAKSDEAQMDPEQRARKLARVNREKEMSKFAYTPIFFRKESSEEDEEDDFEMDMYGTSMPPPHNGGNSSGLGSSAVQSGSSSKKHDDGPIIFYNKAKFCTDLSGDRLGTSLFAPGAYKAINIQPLGAVSRPRMIASSVSAFAELRRPLDTMSQGSISSTESRAISDNDDFSFSPSALRNDLSTESSPIDLMDFEVSGLGGVRPDDNFCIRVRTSQTQTTISDPSIQQRSRIYPKRVLNALAAGAKPTSPSRPQRIIKQEMISASCKSLPSSALPPASFLPFDSTSSADIDSDLDADVSSSEADSESGDGPATALQILNVTPDGYSSDEESEEESTYSDESDDGSIDLLATARQLDPKMIRTKEREYDAALADRLAEEIVAGSSAATAGGGSGFNSPAKAKNALQTSQSQASSSNKKRQSTTSGSMSSRSQLKRSRTSESIGQRNLSKRPKNPPLEK